MNNQIKTEAELDAALARAYELMQMELPPNSKESNELEALSVFISEYEKVHHAFPPVQTVFRQPVAQPAAF